MRDEIGQPMSDQATVEPVLELAGGAGLNLEEAIRVADGVVVPGT